MVIYFALHIFVIVAVAAFWLMERLSNLVFYLHALTCYASLAVTAVAEGIMFCFV